MLQCLETERLILRPPERRDVATLAVLFADFDVSKMTARIPYPYRRADAEAFIARAAAIHEGDGGYVLVVGRKPDGYCLGTVGLERKDGDVHLGFALGKFYWGQGYATEAVGRLVRFAFEVLNAPRVAASHALDNPASARVLSKLGFVQGDEVEIPSAARKDYVLCRKVELTREAYRNRAMRAA